MPAMVSKISSRLQEGGAKADFRFFSLDTFSCEAPSEGPTVLLLELFRFDYPRLTERAARLVEKLVSKRRQLVGLGRTLMLADTVTVSKLRCLPSSGQCRLAAPSQPSLRPIPADWLTTNAFMSVSPGTFSPLSLPNALYILRSGAC